MSIMKKISLFVFAILFSSVVFCQNANNNDSKENNENATETAKKTGDQRFQEMLKSLNLSSDQKQSLKELNKTNKEAKNKISSDSTLSDADKKVKLKELRTDKTKKFLDLLTPEQLEIYKEYKKAGNNKEKE